MVNFNFYAPTEVIFGANKENSVADLIKFYGGKKVLLIYGKNSIEKSGLLKRVCKILKEGNIKFASLKGVQANPLISKVEEGIELGIEENVDFVLAIGGGSVIDSAKAIALGIKSDSKIKDLIGRKDINKALPVGVILTIAAAGSEMSQTSVLTNDQTKLKRSFKGRAMRPKFAILNPELTYTLSNYQSACGIADIIMHTIERYFSKAKTLDITDAFSAKLVENVMNNAFIVLKENDNYKARAEIMWCGSLAHNDILSTKSQRGDWACHQLGHELSAKYGIAHGASLTAVWPTWARYVYSYDKDRFLKFSKEVMQVNKGESDEDIILKGIEKLENFFKEIKLPTSLSELNIEISDEDLEDMVIKASRFDTFKPGNIKELNKKDIKAIYKKAM